MILNRKLNRVHFLTYFLCIQHFLNMNSSQAAKFCLLQLEGLILILIGNNDISMLIGGNMETTKQT